MQTETEAWIEKLEAAAREGKRLPEMTGQERSRIERLMRAAGRTDLASETWRLIPIAAGAFPRLPVREMLAADRLAKASKTTLN